MPPCPQPLADPTPDQRQQPRICIPFSARVRGVTPGGEPFDVAAVLENLSAGGFYLCLKQPVEVGTALQITLVPWSLNSPRLRGEPIQILSEAVRVEFQSNGYYGLAARIERHDFHEDLAYAGSSLSK